MLPDLLVAEKLLARSPPPSPIVYVWVAPRSNYKYLDVAKTILMLTDLQWDLVHLEHVVAGSQDRAFLLIVVTGVNSSLKSRINRTTHRSFI